MITVRVCFEQPQYDYTTRINASYEEAVEYFMHEWINVSSVGENMQRCIAVQFVQYY